MARVNSRSKAVFFVSFLRHLSHPQFKSFSNSIRCRKHLETTNPKNFKIVSKKMLDTLPHSRLKGVLASSLKRRNKKGFRGKISKKLEKIKGTIQNE